MTYEELVKKVKAAYARADASAVAEHLAVQFNVTGEGEGALYLEITDGKIDIQPFEYYDRNAIVTITAQALVDIATGKIKVTDAYNKGILYVDGDLGKVSLLEKIVLKKTPGRKPGSKNSTEKKTTTKKTTTKKTTAKKTTEKKAPAKKTVEEKKAEAPKAAKQPEVVKTVTTKTTAQKAEAPKSTAAKTEAPKAETSDTAAKKTAEKKTAKLAK
jgi:outer membrane biosynthesis protein TonB